MHVATWRRLDTECGVVFERKRSTLQRASPRHPRHLGESAERATARAREQRRHHAQRHADIAAVGRILAHRTRTRARAGDQRDYESWIAIEAGASRTSSKIRPDLRPTAAGRQIDPI